MLRIGIASQNDVKGQAILGAFQQMFPQEAFELIAYAAASGVADQPMSDAETRRGAENRLADVQRALPDCDYWAAVEGGIEDGPQGMVGLAWIVVSSREHSGCARTATFPLPSPMAQLVRDGVELGFACDELYKTSDTKYGAGAIGLLSHNVIDRRQLYQHAAVMALLPMKNPDWY